MVKIFTLTFLIALSPLHVCFANNLKAQAEKEYQELKGKPLPLASDAQVTGLLNLKDPKAEVITRNWKYIFGIKAQNFQPSGSASNDLGETFDLSNRTRTVMPSFEFGLQSKSLQTGSLLISGLILGEGAYANQQTDVQLQSGYKIKDAYLNVIELTAGLGIQLSWAQLQSLALELGYHYGQMSYAQAATNDFANFTESGNLQKVRAQFLWKLSPTVLLNAGFSRNELKATSNIEVENSRYELGTRFIW